MNNPLRIEGPNSYALNSWFGLRFSCHPSAADPHQGLSNQIIDPEGDVGAIAGKIECRERLGGMLKYYQRRAA